MSNNPRCLRSGRISEYRRFVCFRCAFSVYDLSCFDYKSEDQRTRYPQTIFSALEYQGWEIQSSHHRDIRIYYYCHYLGHYYHDAALQPLDWPGLDGRWNNIVCPFHSEDATEEGITKYQTLSRDLYLHWNQKPRDNNQENLKLVPGPFPDQGSQIRNLK